MTDTMSKGDAGSAGASCGSGVVSNGESKSNILQKQMSISKIGNFGTHSNTCTKADEIEVIESGNSQARHPKVSWMFIKRFDKRLIACVVYIGETK